MLEDSKVLVISSSKFTRRYIARLVGSSGFDMKNLSWNRDAIRKELSSQYHLCIIDTDGNEEDARWLVHEMTENYNNTAHLLLASQPANPHIYEMFCSKKLRNLIGKHWRLSSREVIDEIELMSTCQKLIRSDIFGLEKYIAGQARIHQHDILGTEDKREALRNLTEFLDLLTFEEPIRESVILTADELIMNATFNAPRDGDGQSRYSHADRRKIIRLEPSERVRMQYACDGRHIALSVADPFGSLDHDMIIKYLHRSFDDKPVEMERKASGAGLGLYMVFNSSNQLVINIQPGVSTEVIAIFYISRGPLGYKLSGRSFNMFVC